MHGNSSPLILPSASCALRNRRVLASVDTDTLLVNTTDIEHLGFLRRVHRYRVLSRVLLFFSLLRLHHNDRNRSKPHFGTFDNRRGLVLC